MAVNTREGLKQYALRALGAPVLEINVAEEQLQDRLDEALGYWYLYHYDGIERIYMKQIIRASEMILDTPTAESFKINGKVTGATSGATAIVTTETRRSSTGTLLLVRNVTGIFTPGETITDDNNVSAELVSCTLREYDKRYIEVPDAIYGVTRVIPFVNASSSKNLFDLQYQLRLNDLYDLTSTSIIYFKTVMGHLAMLDLELNGYPLWRFNRMNNRLYLDINWETDIPLGDFMVAEVYRIMDPTECPKVYNEAWLKHYVTALFKRQWAVNIKKFTGIQLPGGVILDGDKLYSEAVQEIKELEEELRDKSAPLDMFIG
jgi:hypothetical protein